MHILALTHLFHPAQGGTEIALLELARQLVRKGHQVTVVTSNQTTLEDFQAPRSNPHLPDQSRVEGIRIRRLPLSRARRFLLAKAGALFLRSRMPGGDMLWFMTQLPFLPGMIREAKAIKPDLLYAVPFPTATAYYALRAARFLGCPWVIQPHLHVKDMNPSLEKIIRRIFPRASAILSNTRAEKEYLLKMGLPNEKINVLGQGIDLERLQGGHRGKQRSLFGLGDEPLILFLGRKVENKAIDTLLQAMPLVWNEFPRSVLVLAGQTSPYFQDLWSRTALSGDPRLRSLNAFPEEQKADLLAACDLLVLPSQAESFGVVFLEAWAKGKPVIGARIPAVEAMIQDGADGLLVSYGDPSQLASAITKLLRDPELGRKMGEKGQAKVKERYEITRVAQDMENLFLRLIRP
jgi:glycosyltransferase involved in cell wall biosynthesis